MPRSKTRKRSAAKKRASQKPRANSSGSVPAVPSSSPEQKPQTLLETFKALEKVLALYSPPAKMWIEGSHSKPVTRLTVPSPVVVPGAYGGKPIDLALATLILQKDFVGFYLMPLYVRPSLRVKIPKPLRKLLKGKTCFRLRSADEAMVEHARLAVDAGTQLYRERGWL
jgi:hypothetical protein